MEKFSKVSINLMKKPYKYSKQSFSFTDRCLHWLFTLFFSRKNKDVTIDASKCLSSIQRTLVSTYISTALWWCTLYFINQFQGDKKALYNPFFFSFECQFVASAILFEIQICISLEISCQKDWCQGFLWVFIGIRQWQFDNFFQI